MNLYCDGSVSPRGSRWIVVDENKKVLMDISTADKKTCNECEYLAMIEALSQAKDGDTIFTDSKLVEGQLTRQWAINYEHLKKLHDWAYHILQGKQLVKIQWIRREDNKAGQFLEEELRSKN